MALLNNLVMKAKWGFPIVFMQYGMKNNSTVFIMMLYTFVRHIYVRSYAKSNDAWDVK